MSDDPASNTLTSEARTRSRTKGDAPDHLLRRYFLDARGGEGLGYYADARISTPAFRDTGGRLTTARSDPNVVRDLVAIAKHRGWAAVVVRGDADFRREAWLAAAALDITVTGYRPTGRDRQELERQMAAQARRAERLASSPTPDLQRRRDPATTLRTVETVVRARVSSPLAQERLLQAARLRIASWLERGAGVSFEADGGSGRRRDHPRERQRTR